jgi:nitrilase
MLIDPWGDILAKLPEGEGLVMGKVDHDRLAEIRLNLPALTHKVI